MLEGRFVERADSSLETSSHHPLHLLICRDEAAELGAPSSTYFFVRFCAEVSTDGGLAGMTLVSVVYVSGRPLADGGRLPPSPCCTPFHCTATFLNHYSLDASRRVFFQPAAPLPLQKVFLSVRSSRAFEWMQKFKFSIGLLLEVCDRGVLMRTDDVLLAPYHSTFLEDRDFNKSFYQEVTVLECTPFRQGVLTTSTELFMILSDEANRIPAAKGTKRHLGNQWNTSLTRNLIFSNFCSLLQYPEEVTSAEGTLSSDEATAVTLNTRVVCEQELLSLCRKRLNPEKFDPNYIICLPKSVMLKHGLYDGNIVEVSSSGNQTNGILASKNETFRKTSGSSRTCNERSKLALVKCLLKLYDQTDSAFTTPILAFNIQPPPQILHSNLSIVLKKLPLMQNLDYATQLFGKEGKCSKAAKIVLAKVRFPNYDQTIPPKTLKDYFLIPRLLAVGDVFAVENKENSVPCLSYSENTFGRFPYHYKVDKVKPVGCQNTRYIVIPEVTRILVKGSVYSFVPRLITGLLPYWEQSLPSGLDKYTKKLLQLILPFLTDSLSTRIRESLSPAILITGPDGCGKATVVEAVARILCLHMITVNCQNLCCQTSKASCEKLKAIISAGETCIPCILLLRDLQLLGKTERESEDARVGIFFRDCIKQLRSSIHEFPLIIVGTSKAVKEINADVYEAFFHEVTMEVPTETERESMFNGLTQHTRLSSDVSTTYIAQRTAGFVLGDMVALIAQASKHSYQKILRLCGLSSRWMTTETEENIAAAEILMEHIDFEKALDTLQAAHSERLGSPRIPNISWEDIGGLSEAKQEILDTIQLPLQHPEILAAGLRRSGVLLYGPPGTGKTLIAKAVATQCSLNFLSVKGPELMNKYVGQSEENVREVFRRARDAAPCVIFFDELDSLAPSRGRNSDTGGVMDRIVSQLLAELDGLHKCTNLFVIGATNRPDLLDPALLRPGRFDKIVYMGVAGDKESQLKIMKALTRRLQLTSDVKLESIVEKCSTKLTGADFYGLCSDAMMNAVRRNITLLETGEVDKRNCHVLIKESDFLDALNYLAPSLSESELQRYTEVQKHFDGM